MLKRLLFFILQFCAFLALMDIGGNWDVIRLAQQIQAMQKHTTAYNPIPVIKTQIGATHILIANGVIFAAVLFLLILLVQAARKKLKTSAGLTTLAFLLAVILGFVMKFGLPPVS